MKNIAWQKFAQSGKISDYLYYASLKENTSNDSKKQDENKNSRTGNKGNEYR